MSVWLCQIAKNLWYDQCRKNKNNIDIEEMEALCFQDLNTVEEKIISNEEKISIYKKMQNLDDKTKDSNTGEQLIFWNETKLYDKAEGGTLESTPASMFASPDSTANIMMAIHPFVFIGTQKNDDIECYNIKFNTVYEVISKDRGLLLYSNEENNMRNIQYKFNTVTDEDVAKPNLSEYTLNNKN